MKKESKDFRIVPYTNGSKPCFCATPLTYLGLKVFMFRSFLAFSIIVFFFWGGGEEYVFFGDFCAAKERGWSTVQLMKQYGRQVTTCIPKRHTPPKKTNTSNKMDPYQLYKWSYNPTISGVILLPYLQLLRAHFEWFFVSFQHHSIFGHAARVNLLCRSKVVSTSRKMSLTPQEMVIRVTS